MRAAIHPEYQRAQVTCSCGNVFTVGSTKGVIHVDLCYNCHPFYTGQHKFVDTASRIEKFQKKMSSAQPRKVKKVTINDEDNRPKTLKEMLQALKK